MARSEVPPAGGTRRRAWRGSSVLLLVRLLLNKKNFILRHRVHLRFQSRKGLVFRYIHFIISGHQLQTNTLAAERLSCLQNPIVKFHSSLKALYWGRGEEAISAEEIAGKRGHLMITLIHGGSEPLSPLLARIAGARKFG